MAKHGTRKKRHPARKSQPVNLQDIGDAAGPLAAFLQAAGEGTCVTLSYKKTLLGRPADAEGVALFLTREVRPANLSRPQTPCAGHLCPNGIGL